MALPRILQFNNDDVIEFNFGDGSITTTPLGGGYAFDPRAPIYNIADDLIYVAEFGGARVIKYNPRTNSIVTEVDLSAYGNTILDVQGDHIWMAGGGNLHAILCSDFSLAFTAAGFFGTYIAIAAAATGGRIVATSDGISVDVITITSPTTFSANNIVLPTPVSGSYPFGNDSGYQRPYIATGDQMFIYCQDNVVSGVLGAIVDLVGLSAAAVSQPGGNYYGNAQNAQWDAHNNAIVLRADDSSDSATCGVVIDVLTDSILGFIGKGVDNFYDEPRPLGDGTALVWNGFQHGGIFDEGAPSSTPLSVTPGADFVFSYSSGFVIVPPPPSSFFWENLVRTREDL